MVLNEIAFGVAFRYVGLGGQPTTLPTHVRLVGGLVLNLASGSIHRPINPETEEIEEVVELEERNPIVSIYR